jgi:8-oxo-dGTP diphosphatase
MSSIVPKKNLLVVGAIFTKKGRILIAQRPEGTSSAGRWEFPGGKVELGEDPRDALKRECLEELNIHVQVGGIYETIYTCNEERGILLLFYKAIILSGEPTSMEGNAFKWVTIDEMRGYDLLDPDKPLVEMFGNKFPGG